MAYHRISDDLRQRALQLLEKDGDITEVVKSFSKKTMIPKGMVCLAMLFEEDVRISLGSISVIGRDSLNGFPFFTTSLFHLGLCARIWRTLGLIRRWWGGLQIDAISYWGLDGWTIFWQPFLRDSWFFLDESSKDGRTSASSERVKFG